MFHRQTEGAFQPSEYQKWDYITLSNFRSKSCWATFSYAWLWFLVITAVAVYAADTYTAVNLLIFNRWSSEVQPTLIIPLAVSKWIFAICILLSWLLCLYEWIRAVRVIRRGNVAESYLDPLAVNLQSIRVFGQQGQGWRRFLVFAELTKSKKGADYVALFVYFQFKGAVRVLLAEGPRQVVNALTLWPIMSQQLLKSANQVDSKWDQFWANVQILAKQDREQAAILFTMLFTLVIWTLSFISFVVACLLFVGFLWHYIPQEDGRLSRYCRRKVNRRLGRVIDQKFKKALAKDEARRLKQEMKASANGEPVLSLKKAPTLPALSDSDIESMRPPSPATTITTCNIHDLERQDTTNSALEREPKLPEILETGRPVTLSRNATQDSVRSDKPLLQAPNEMGKSPVVESSNGALDSPRDQERTSNPSYPPFKPGAPITRRPLPQRNISGHGTSGAYRPYNPYNTSAGPPLTMDRERLPENAFPPANRIGLRNAPGPSGQEMDHADHPQFHKGPQASFRPTVMAQRPGAEQSFPLRAAAPLPPRFGTAPPPRGMNFQSPRMGPMQPPPRAGTAPPPTGSYGDWLFEAYGDVPHDASAREGHYALRSHGPAHYDQGWR